MTTSPSDPGLRTPVPAGAVPDMAVDLAVVGAGPAGLAAAVAAADAGAVVALIDAEPVVGGQFWRHPAGDGRPGGVTDREVSGLHHDLRRYRRLRGALARHAAAGTVRHLARHEVWSIEPLPAAEQAPPSGVRADPLPPFRFAVNAMAGGPQTRRSTTVRARALVLATGAYDLQLPFPGWDLPGVMTAGGVQSLLKGHAVLAGRRVVVAGTGPFLLSVASGLARSGSRVVGVFEAARPGGWLRELRGLRSVGSKAMEGAGYARDLLRHQVGYHPGWTVLAASGEARLATVTVAPLNAAGVPITARARTIAADVLAVGWGFVPQLDLPLALGCDTTTAPGRLPVVVVDADQRSSVPGVYAAGEICGVGGATLAAVEGEIAGAAAAAELGVGLAGAPDASRSDRQRDGDRRLGQVSRLGQVGRLGRLGRRVRRLRAFAEALQRVYPVPDAWMAHLRDDTLVCRCEEVSAGSIRELVRRDGVSDARTAKLLARPGMGWCQGRICGYATECLVASAGAGSADHRPIPRSVAAPVPLGLLAEEGSARFSEQ